MRGEGGGIPYENKNMLQVSFCCYKLISLINHTAYMDKGLAYRDSK